MGIDDLFGNFGDHEELYRNLETAETDRERGAAFIEYALSDLDSGYEPEQVDIQRYEEEIVPHIENELGLEAPDIELLKYEDSDQLLYDTITGTLTNTPVSDFLGQNMTPNPADPMSRAMTTVHANLFKTLASTLGPKFASRIGGVADPYGEHLTENVPDHEVIAYSVPGVNTMSDKTGESYDDTRDYVLTHEGIHSFQFAAYPNLLEARRDFIEETVGDMENTPGMGGGITLGDLMQNPEDVLGGSPMDLLKNPGSLLDGLKPDMEMPEMTLIEGHAEFYTDRITDIDMREQAEANKEDSGPLGDLIGDLTGLSAKKDQYVEGKELFEALHDRGGNEYVDYTMRNPPTMEQIRDPEGWTDHVESQLGDA